METSTIEKSKYKSTGSIEQCIADCLACYQECMSCLPYSLSLGGKYVEQKHLTLMMECAQICNTSATLMQIEGQFSHQLCQLCAKVCQACEESCTSIDEDDSMMHKCADMCRKCADSCNHMEH